MIGLKARSTLVPAETWLREFIPYGTPCDEPCEPAGGAQRVDQLEAQLADLKTELDLLRATLIETAAPKRKRSGADS